MLDQTKKELKNKKRRWWLAPAIFLIVVLILAGLMFGFEKIYAQKFYPGVKIGYINATGMTKDQVLSQLKTIEDNIHEKGLIFRSIEKEVVIEPIVVAVTDPDLAKEILTFNWKKTVDQAFAVGREGNIWTRLVNQVAGLVSDRQVSIEYGLDKARLGQALKESFGQFENPAKNAELKIDGDSFEIIPEESGTKFDYLDAITRLENNVRNLEFTPIELELLPDDPKIKTAQAGSAVNSLEDILKIDQLTLKIDSQSWPLKKDQFVDWLEFQVYENEIIIGANKEKILSFLKPIVQAVNVEPRDAKFKLEGGRVTEFQASQDGKTLDLEDAYQKINARLTQGVPGEIGLIVAVQPAKVATGDVNDLGITELVGRGTSNFAGSPSNRRHNIGVGAASVSGLLIAPGEEFSLLQALGEINGATGYRQELVIKGDRTIPEYGGGLCQIGTTSFRAALNSGLPITARRNHSYRVGYYEPPVGMDATIYDPAPDFRFVNDTGNNLLWLTYIDGDELVFELYGTKDGRQIEISEPVVYNYTSPGEPRYVETTELAPGEKRKVESAHNGAEADFDYKVTYPDGEVKEETFHSRYVAWKETWLIGVDPTAASSTETIIENPEQ